MTRQVSREREADLRGLLHAQQASAEVAAFIEYIQVRMDKALRRLAGAEEAAEIYRQQGVYNELTDIIQSVRKQT